MRPLHFKNAAVNVVRDMEKNHTLAFAAALAYYFVLALFPFLIFLSAVVAHGAITMSAQETVDGPPCD